MYVHRRASPRDCLTGAPRSFGQAPKFVAAVSAEHSFSQACDSVSRSLTRVSLLAPRAVSAAERACGILCDTRLHSVILHFGDFGMYCVNLATS